MPKAPPSRLSLSVRQPDNGISGATRRFAVTIFYDEASMSREEIRNAFQRLVNGQLVQFASIGYETTTSGKPHLQCYIITWSRVRPSTVASWLHPTFPSTSNSENSGITVRPTYADDAANIKYTKKSGDWFTVGFHTERAEDDLGPLNDDVPQVGARRAAARTVAYRKRDQRNHDVHEEAMRLAREDRLDEIPAHLRLRYFRPLQDLKNEPVPHKYNRLPHQPGVWIYGAANSGKTQVVVDSFPSDENGNPTRYVKNLTKWWDKYKGEPVVHIDEWSPAQRGLLADLKQWADTNTFAPESKGGTLLIRPEWIIVTSNYSIDECFPNPVEAAPIHKRFLEIHMRRLSSNPPSFSLTVEDLKKHMDHIPRDVEPILNPKAITTVTELPEEEEVTQSDITEDIFEPPAAAYDPPQSAAPAGPPPRSAPIQRSKRDERESATEDFDDFDTLFQHHKLHQADVRQWIEPTPLPIRPAVNLLPPPRIRPLVSLPPQKSPARVRVPGPRPTTPVFTTGAMATYSVQDYALHDHRSSSKAGEGEMSEASLSEASPEPVVPEVPRVMTDTENLAAWKRKERIQTEEVEQFSDAQEIPEEEHVQEVAAAAGPVRRPWVFERTRATRSIRRDEEVETPLSRKPQPMTSRKWQPSVLEHRPEIELSQYRHNPYVGRQAGYVPTTLSEYLRQNPNLVRRSGQEEEKKYDDRK